MANVTQMPPSETDGTPDTSPPIEADSTPKTPELAKKHKAGPGRGKKKEEGATTDKAIEFFDRVAAIPPAEWGQRAFMYVYIDEPVLQANTFGKYTYAKKLHKPIFDLEPVKDWYGSCKGWLSLNFRKSTKQNGDQLATYEFEIFDIHTPPKLPKKSWANDQRNLKWEAILPPEKPDGGNQGAGVLLDAVRTYREIREDIKQEMPEEKPTAPAVDPTRNTLETLKLAKEFLQSNGDGKPAADPLATAISILNTLMQVRAENPMVDMLSKQLEASRAELSKALEELRKAQAPVPTKGLLEQLTEFAAIADKIEPLRKLFGGGAGETVVRSSRTTGLDILREIAPQFLQSPIAQGLGALFASMAAKSQQGAVPPPTQTAAAGQQAAGESEGEKLNRIGRNISEPLIVEFFEPWAESGGTAQGNSGASYALRINDLWPADFEYLQTLGTDRIVALFMNHELTAPRLRPRAQLFRQFISEFLAYDPDGDDPPPTQEPQHSRVRSLEVEGENES